MRVVFGWNNFRIKSYNPQDLGLTQNADPGYRIEIRQSYFHLFWIPFFGLGKKWAINKGGKLYELPAEFVPVVRSLQHEVRTPWYTFAGPILILAGGLIFWAYSEYEEYQYRQSSISYFKKSNDALENELKQLDDKDIITMRDVSGEWYDDKLMYAKVEKVMGETVTLTPISSASNQPAEVEASYMRYKEQVSSFDIPLRLLLEAFPKKYDSSSGKGILQYGRKIMNNDRNYIVKEVVPHFGPAISDRGTGSFGIMGIRMTLINSGWPAVISAIKTLEGDVDWSPNVGTKTGGKQTEYGNSFDLFSQTYKPGEYYKLLLTLTDSSSQVHHYEIDGVNLQKTIKKL